MKTYTEYSIVRGIAATLVFLAIGLPILVLVSSMFLSVGFVFSFLSERSCTGFRETFFHGMRGYCDDVRSVLDNLGVFSFHE